MSGYGPIYLNSDNVMFSGLSEAKLRRSVELGLGYEPACGVIRCRFIKPYGLCLTAFELVARLASRVLVELLP